MKKNEYETDCTEYYRRFIKEGKEHLWVGGSNYLHGRYEAQTADYRWFNFNGFKLGAVKIGSDSFIIGD